jgi:uncharacterized protein (DUF1697 family)
MNPVPPSGAILELAMTVVICMLRGVNVGGHNMIKMEALRALHESLGLLDAQTYIQSGNVVFRATGRDLVSLAKKIGNAIEAKFGFRPGVILRTASDLREAIARNPFAARPGIDPRKLVVTFLLDDPGPEARKKALSIKADPEELRIVSREVYVYYPDGMGRSKLPAALIEKTLQTPGTARNWNTVTKLLEMAEKLEASR